MITISRNRVFNDGYLTEGEWIRIWYGYHSKERLNERSKGSLGIRPERIKLSRDNTVKGYILDNKLNKFVVKVAFTNKEDLYLVLTESYFNKGEYFVKSVWFKDKKRKPRIHATTNVNTAAVAAGY